MHLRATAVVLMAAGVGRPATLPLPERPATALGGAELARELERLDLAARDERVVAEVLAGNVPDFLRRLVPITIERQAGETVHRVVTHVTPDYLALGSDADSFLMPMAPGAAQRVADALGCLLPTRRMVDAIYAAAAVKLAPSPIPPSPAMIRVETFWAHNQTIRAQRAEHLDTHPLGALVAGHKKDVVITPRLADRPRRVAIYGWHRLDGRPIQPLHLGHTVVHVDYSHGIRLVRQAITLDGRETTIPEVLADPALAELLSDEGVVSVTRYPTGTENASGARD